MTETDFKEELEQEPFVPLRLHLVSGKTLDVVRPGVAWPLKNRLLVFRKPARTGIGAEGYDVVAYENIERVEQLDVGKREKKSR